ncbi:ADP-ribosylation factor 1 [Cytospora mali]|uniref:ADP-ribosylation factor 1 n=1 Tax=Cytospora mali TaxID=578113 RepID=A0A194VUD9_CYTMA|nr:ADP-ribosylation factor 1 [Valsa mali]
MSSTVTQLRKWLFGNRQFRVQVVGGEGSGKTTFLYTLKYNGNPYDEPSALLGYNFETVEYPRGWEFTIYDVWPGCSRFVLRNGPFHFMSPETLIWYIHDCTDNKTSMLFCPEQLAAMKEKGAKYIWCILSKQDLLPPEQRDSIVAEHRANVEALLRLKADPAGIKWFIVADPGWNLKEGNFVRSFVKSVTQQIVEMDKENELEYRRAADDALFKIPNDEELGATIEGAEIKDADVFWKVFITADLNSWNHLDHLQAGYLIMLRSIKQKHGLLKCASTFLEHLARLREARPDMFRNTAHFTMTAFWIIQMRIAIFTFQYDANDGSVPTENDFRAIMMHTPSLMSTRLWTLYYTKEVLFAPEARTDFVMPDLQPFPKVAKPLLKSLAEGMVGVEDEEQDLWAHGLPDTRFIGPDRLPRWAFEVMRNSLDNDVRRGPVVKDALAEFQADTMKLRANYPKLADDGDVPPYSETQAYFWIQYIHSSLSDLGIQEGKADQGLPSDTDVQSMNFEQFQEVCSVDASVWELYYSQDLWESVGARLKFVNPDKKPLPNHSGLLRQMWPFSFSFSWLYRGRGR